ncbi:ABC transporter substrate-binding protein [Microbacterium foliorum]|uniref:ABC transporter substrate-binding protein n=1 Tax=Microbacterium foliorum TaxID=104336 RepID=UPI001E1105A2|nr:ABC transporter substrate-binding protein [Microbacterium foliorum]CAH0234903.1 Putative ABC transporter substrate-binding lipoprotein YhfQ [Microbacterium foliorum]CAH0247208.1 Putative ABC transporter substrate-binding lipoprotein YhfQ [Microbacterium foliorum]
MPLTRTRALGALLVAVVSAAALTACAPATENAEGAPVVDSDAFPVTVEHAYGDTEIPEQPQRVVTVGVTEQDALWALGVKPVGVTEWYGGHDFASWPWADEARGDSEPEVLTTTDGLDFEAIALLDPDLIIGTNAGMTEEDYDRLSDIAPTIAHSGDYSMYFEPWDVQTLQIGEAVGLKEEAQKLVDDIDAQFAEAAAAHPEFAGKSIVFLQNAIYDGAAIAYQDGLSTDFLTDLGFTIPPDIDAYAPDDTSGGQATIPVENLDVLNSADVLIWGTESDDDIAALEDEPFVTAISAMQNSSVVYTDGVTAGAIYFTSALSLPYVLDALVPALADAVAGDGPARTAE